jgi:hypothetical protein
VGCPDIPDISADAGTTGPFRVGPEGGEVVREGAVLSIPPGALDQEIILSVTVVDTGMPEVPDRKRISFGYRISPSNLVLRTPMTLRIPWIDDRQVSGVKPSSYDMRRNQGTEPYLALPGATADELLPGLVKAETEKLGTFWITSPATPTLSAPAHAPNLSFLCSAVAPSKRSNVRKIDGLSFSPTPCFSKKVSHQLRSLTRTTTSWEFKPKSDKPKHNVPISSASAIADFSPTISQFH